MAANRWGLIAGTCVLVGVLAGSLGADIVYLHDGRAIRGKVTSADGAAMVQVETPFGPMQFRSTLVKKIEKGEPQPAASTTQPDAPAGAAAPAAGDPGRLDPAHRQKFALTRAEADKLDDGPAGLAVWDAYLAENPPGVLGELARKEQAVWKERADKDLVRFGPQWLPRNQVAERLAKADELVGKAEGASDVDEAAKLFDEAAKAHPYRIDIPMKKAMTFYRAKKMVEYGVALGQVVKLDGNHPAARNNLGVLAAQQKQWATAIVHLSKAGAVCDNDTVLDNLDQAIAMAADSGAASAATSDDRSLRQVVDVWHAAGRRVGEARWGNTWVSEDQYKTYVKENAEIDRKIAVNNTQIGRLRHRYNNAMKVKQLAKEARDNAAAGRYGNRGSDYYERLAEEDKKADAELKEITDEVTARRADSDALAAKRNIPPHASRLVLLDTDGVGQLDTVSVQTTGGETGAKPAAGMFD